MRFSQLSAIALSFQFSLARPTSSSRRSLIPLSDTTEAGRPRVVQLQQVHTGSVKSASKSEAEEEEKENGVEIAGTLNTPVALKGGDLKQDVVYVASVGDFEVEYQAKTTRTLTVSENKSPAAAPAGFKALEPSSFKVNFTEGGGDLTLGQIDYIFDATSKL
ncbi:hypothetical protein NUW58_g2456 [Xylaria curta]|uniref:Uncharacterized protein n=1 Tax=Xylaria curta TaxID=42375 RepID=A0ACC1PHX1_9PEZI|nr:hypothetical protein NUW58_g2456 [Xylaria curta]